MRLRQRKAVLLHSPKGREAVISPFSMGTRLSQPPETCHHTSYRSAIDDHLTSATITSHKHGVLVMRETIGSSQHSLSGVLPLHSSAREQVQGYDHQPISASTRAAAQAISI